MSADGREGQYEGRKRESLCVWGGGESLQKGLQLFFRVSLEDGDWK